MLRLEPHGDVTRVRMSSARGRLLGYDVSAYLMNGVLVDTGFARAARPFARWLDATAIDGVIVTHWHEDHAGNASTVADRQIPLAITDATIDTLASPTAQSIRSYRRFLWGQPAPVRTPIVPFTPDVMRIIAAPGHSRDHVIVWDEARATLFSGDLFLGGRVRATFPDEDPRQLVRTLRDVATLQPHRMFCAHRGLVPDPVAALIRKAEWLEETIGRIDARIDAGWGDKAIRDDVLGQESIVAIISAGEYSKLTFVRACRRTGRS